MQKRWGFIWNTSPCHHKKNWHMYIFNLLAKNLCLCNRSNQFQFAVFWSNHCYKFKRRNLGKKLVDARINLIDMHLIQSLKNEFCFDLPMFSKYLATSINNYFYKMTLVTFVGRGSDQYTYLFCRLQGVTWEMWQVFRL